MNTPKRYTHTEPFGLRIHSDSGRIFAHSIAASRSPPSTSRIVE